MQARDQRLCHQELGPPDAMPPNAARHCRISLVPAPESTAAARDFTIATLRGWYLDAMIQDTVLVVSELVTNAMRHGAVCTDGNTDGARVVLTWSCQAGRLICTVTDRSFKPPVLAPADPDAESGRGLQVVHALAIAWGWTTLSTRGKAVWAAFQVPGGRQETGREPVWNPAWERAQ